MPYLPYPGFSWFRFGRKHTAEEGFECSPSIVFSCACAFIIFITKLKHQTHLLLSDGSYFGTSHMITANRSEARAWRGKQNKTKPHRDDFSAFFSVASANHWHRQNVSRRGLHAHVYTLEKVPARKRFHDSKREEQAAKGFDGLNEVPSLSATMLLFSRLHGGILFSCEQATARFNPNYK